MGLLFNRPIRCIDLIIQYSKIYIGQTGRTFKIRYNEHINTIKSNK
jgi:hypothetical protein